MKFNNVGVPNVYIPPAYDYCLPASGLALTDGTPVYYKYDVNFYGFASGIRLYCSSFTSNSVYKVAFYNYAASGAVSKLTNGQGSTTVTATGFFTINFTNPIYFTKGTDLFVGILKLSGTSQLANRASGPGATDIAFSGATSAADFPASESTRTSQSNYVFYSLVAL